MRYQTTDTRPLPVCDGPPGDDPAGPPLEQRVRSAIVGARERPASVADLREMISTARPEIVEAGSDTRRRQQLSHELRQILVALEPHRPDLVEVRDHWKQVRDLLGPAAGCGRIPQITDLLIVLLRRAVAARSGSGGAMQGDRAEG